MSPVNAHAMVHHRVLNLIDNGCPSSFDAQGFLYLHKGMLRDGCMLHERRIKCLEQVHSWNKYHLIAH